MINLMFAGNEKVFDGILIASLSILKHCKEEINVYLLTMDLSDINPIYKEISHSQIQILNRLYSNVNSKSKVIKIDVKDIYLKELSLSPNNESAYTPYALLRLLAEKIKQIPDKILYLDSDIVANGNINELYNVNINDYEIAGVRDYYGKFFFYPNYLNSGVLLMNMKKIRQTQLLSKAINLCNKKKVFLADQTAINKYATKKLILPTFYNEQKKLKKNTIIRHFSMTFKIFPKFKKINIKPWQINDIHNVLKIHNFDDILEEYENIKKEQY